MATTKRKAKAHVKPAPAPVPAPAAPPRLKVKGARHVVKVAVDKKGNFTYTLGSGGDASSLITRRQGDTVSWSVRYRGKRVPFQIEFAGTGPFGFADRVIRSSGKDSSPLTVNVPDSYEGNYVMEYRVTLENGWSDDPDVVPILSDGTNGLVAPTIVTIAEDGRGGLTLSPPAASASMGSPVLWKWAGTPKGEFTLTFDDPPPGWPVTTASSSQQIALTFPVAGKDEAYAIKLNNSTLFGTGKLTIT